MTRVISSAAAGITAAEITSFPTAPTLTILIEGDEQWRGDFRLPDTYSELQPGSYPDLQRFPFHDPAGGLSTLY